MKNTTLFIALVLFSASNAHAADWNFKDANIASIWKPFDNSTPSPQGFKLGPSSGGDYAVSGVKLGSPVEVKNKKFTFTCEFKDFTLDQPAPPELENGNDFRINLVFAPTPEPAWENDSAVLNVALLYSAINKSLYAGIFGKGAGMAKQGTTFVAEGSGAFLGDNSGAAPVKTQVNVAEDKISAVFSSGDTTLQKLEFPLPANLKELLGGKLHILVYQQNIGKGSGSVVLESAKFE